MMKSVLWATLCCLTLWADFARADEYPNRPIRLIVPFPGGSGSDVIARIVVERMGSSLGQRFIVENRPGAGGVTGTHAITTMPADGYTLLFTASGPLTVNKVLMSDLPYDPERDFAPIGRVVTMPNVLAVSATLPVRSVSEFVGFAKQKSPTAPLTYSSIGKGSASHLAGAYFAYSAGLEMTHVPYRAMAQLVADLINGQVPVTFTVLSNVVSSLQTGSIKVLAVAADKRVPAIQAVPTLTEAGYEQPDTSAWFALLAPAGTAGRIVARLNEELRHAVSDRSVRDRFDSLGAVVATTTPGELSSFISAEIARWRDIVSRTRVTLDR